MQLPSIQLDLVVEEVGVPESIANRNPQPGEAQAPLDATIEFDYLRPDGFLPATADFVVTIASVIAWSSGAFQNGWTGSIVRASPDGGSVRFALSQTLGSFASGQEVQVQVEVGSFSATWSFFAYDITPPLLSIVRSVNKDQVLVVFNEPVTMASAAILGDALNPRSYTIERVTRPAATPSVAKVDQLSTSSVLLTTAFELTFGAGYMLVVSGITDEFDNVFLPPDNVAEFAGWLPPFPDGRKFLLHNFVPAFALAQDSTDDLRLFLGCLQDTTNLLMHLIDKWAEILDPDVAPEAFVDAMLLDLGNPFAFDLTVEAKRKLAKILVRIYQLKGTVPGIIDVVRFFLGIEVTVQVFNGLGWKLGYDKISSSATVASPNPAIIGAGGRALYSFRVLTTEMLSDVQRSEIVTIATYMKGAPEHMIGVRDGTVLPTPLVYWKLAFTKLGFVKIAGT
jgi:phage tail-like protein